jgi:hypothetical protein
MRTENTNSDFIREQPSTMSAAEVVEKGKAAALKFDASFVSKVRRRAVASGTHAKTPSRAARDTSAAPSHGSIKPVKSKAQFVRGLPSNTPAKEVVAQAKAAGISITENHVYGVRAGDKRAKTKSGARSNTSKAAAAAASTVNGSASAPKVSAGAEALLKAVAAEIGLGNAIELLRSERARVRGLIGG